MYKIKTKKVKKKKKKNIIYERSKTNMRIIKKMKYIITIIFISILIITYFTFKKHLENNKYKNIKDIEIKEHKVVMEEKEKSICSVDIKGAIKEPNVYSVDCNSTVNDIIKLAGGLNNNADTSVTNLAKKVTNEMVIIIYTKEQVKNSNILDTVEKECVCQNIKNDGCINTKITSNIGDNNQEEGLININAATKEKLITIPGIGESKANAIIKYRETNGLFKNIEDIQKVDGIGTKLYEEIKTYITT